MNYCTVSVKFCECTVVPAVPVTMIVYVPAGVPAWITGAEVAPLNPPPPQAVTISSKSPATNCAALCRVRPHPIPATPKVSGSHNASQV